MNVEMREFGSLWIEDQPYHDDVVIAAGRVSLRDKRPSRPFRDPFGHTPLSADEQLPWDGPRLVIGTGAQGNLPVLPDVYDEARRRGVDLVVLPTRQACEALRDIPAGQVNAVLHATC